MTQSNNQPTPTGTTDERSATAVAVACSDLVAGEVVTWTHVSTRHSSINMTRRHGTVVGKWDKKPDCWLVKWRGKEIPAHRSQLRRKNERSTLDEYVDAQMPAPANR